jgi:DNA gyrase subunit B
MAGVAKKATYTATDDIQVLEGLEPVRVRPSMYIGSTDSKGLHHLVWEIVDNCVDEYLNSFADLITVTLHKGSAAITIEDNGRGIPVDLHPKFKISGLELVLTKLHAGGKFSNKDTNYSYSGGLHGVGASVVNALSKSLVATVKRDGVEYVQQFAKGIPQTKLEKGSAVRGHGTRIRFEPDETIFRVNHFDFDTIRQRLEDMAYIHSGLTINLIDENTGTRLELKNPGGLPSFLEKLVKDAEKPTVTVVPFAVSRQQDDRIEVAMQWTQSTEEVYRSYVNGIRTSFGGTHENGLKSAIRKAIQNYIETHDDAKKAAKDVKITADDIREGLVAILSVFVKDPQFQGQTKDKLNNPELESAVDNFVRPALETWLNTNKSIADDIINRIILAARAREASREASKVARKTPGSRRGSLPGKLADCKAGNLDDSELFIVEGDSAGGSAKQGRNNKTQAVLPLRGKILNGEDLTTSKVLQNQELADLVNAIGTGAGDRFHYDGLRYGKIILLMDADADGCHICTLLLDFFYRHMPELVRKGHIYIAQPPLYRIDVGKETHWAKNDEHKESIIAGLRANAKYDITRFKGLGEMPFRVLAETTLDPRSRTILKVNINEVLDVHNTFKDLLGKVAEPRYDFVMKKAEQTSIDELDV